MNIEYNYDGSMTISEIIDGHRAKHTYYYFTKTDAIKHFKKKCIDEQTEYMLSISIDENCIVSRSKE